MSIDASITVNSVVVEHQTSSGLVRALDGVSFSVAGGSSVAITGPSGGGKSTLLGVIGGLAQPTSGTVRIGDSEISDMSERDRSDFRRSHIGFVYQADNLLPFLTLLETSDSSWHSTVSLRVPESRLRCWPTSAWPAWRTDCPTISPAGSDNGPRWPER